LTWIYPKEAEEEFLESDLENALVLSASKDATIKIWSVQSQHCMETHIAQTNGECWALSVTPDMSGCITAGNDGELKVWSIASEALIDACRTATIDENRKILINRGILFRESKERTTGLTWHPSADYFAVHSATKAIEIWRIRTETEVQKMLQRKRRRKKEKEKEKSKQDDEDETALMTNGHDDNDLVPTLTDSFTQHLILRTTSKISSVDWIPGKSKKTLQLLAAGTNNSLEVYSIPTKKGEKDEDSEYTKTHSLEFPGHRTDVRGIALSSDDRMLATASSGHLKIWNVKTGACLRTLECGYALCCTFLPGDKIVLVGTKSGDLELYDIASSTLIQSFNAHEGAIWSLQVHPNGKSCATGAADKVVKFWEFKVVQEDIPGTKRSISLLNLSHTRTLKLSDEVLSICFSPDAKVIAVSTLDNTVKVFFNDSLKLFLNLYGHKLPVISISISSDSKLIATSSADKNIRLWGLDFGDCHKALFGHADSIMGVKFVPEPENPQDVHLFFSISKDKTLKCWDGDKFEQVQKLTGHHGEIWAMAMSRTGEFVVTVSHDKSIRIWSMIDDLIFLEEEREKELEELYDATLTTSLDADADAFDATRGGEDAVAPTKQTPATLTSAEKIQEALTLGMADLAVVEEWRIQKQNNPNIAPPRRDPLFLALGDISAEQHVLSTLSSLPAQQLTDALLILPYSTITPLLTFVHLWVRSRANVPLACRVLFFELKVHQPQIVASRALKGLLGTIRQEVREALSEMRELMGVNGAALRSIADVVRERGVGRLEDVEKEEERDKGKKREFVDMA
jgi:U3 small nucleolar RNA-associated protein 12